MGENPDGLRGEVQSGFERPHARSVSEERSQTWEDYGSLALDNMRLSQAMDRIG